MPIFNHDPKGYREYWPWIANSIVFGFADPWHVDSI